MKIDCTPDPLLVDSLFTHFMDAIEQAHQNVPMSKIEVKPTLNPDEHDFKVTFADLRTWFQVLKHDPSNVWSMRTTQMDYFEVREVAPFRNIRLRITELLDSGVNNIKVDF